MSEQSLLAISVASWLVAVLSATAAKVMREFSGRELAVYCRQRNRQNLFDEILDQHDQVAIGADSLHIVGTAVFVVSTTLGMAGWLNSITPATQFIVAVASVSAFLLVAMSWIPAAVVRLWAAPFLYHTWRIWVAVGWLVLPISIGCNLADAVARRLAGQPENQLDEEEAFEDEIITMVAAGERDGLLETDAREMIEGVIELGDTDLADIMTPRAEIDAMDIELDWTGVLRFVAECGRTRIPVYEKTLDNIVGVLFVKDLLREWSMVGEQPQRNLREMLRPPWFVPHTKPVDDMLQEFLRTRNHLAIVLDEYDGVTGVVSIEDVLEEIVGEIVDETDKDEESGIKQIDDTTAEVVGRFHVDELNERLGLALPESDDFDTIGGLVVHRLGRIPLAGETVTEENVRIAVLDASRRRVERVKIERLEGGNGKKEITED